MIAVEQAEMSPARATIPSPHRPGRLGTAHWPTGDGPTVLDIFAGGGGLSLGFRSAGYRIIAAVDKDPVAAEVYRKNAPEVLFIGPTQDEPEQGDITVVDGVTLLTQAGVAEGKLDLLIGGPPCQGYSVIGQRKADDARNLLYRQFVRLLDELRPQAFLFENVRGLIHAVDTNGVKVLDTLLSAFRALGYSATPHLIDAVNYGIPQYRQRLFIVGTRDGSEITIPLSLPEAPIYVSVLDAIGDLPSTVSNLATLPYASEPESDYAKLLRGDTALAANSQSTKHDPKLIQRLIAVAPGGKDEPTRHRRLDPAKPAWTLRAGTRRRTTCRPIHPAEHRVITVREAARLSSFPDDFWLPEGKAPAHMIIGNSVPPLLAHHLAIALATHVFTNHNPQQ